jgi:hypothetical protein
MWKNKNKQKQQTKLRKKRAHALFIIVPLNLTRNSTSSSLARGYCLRTLIYHMTLTTECKFYERIYLILNFFKKNVQFSFMQEPETDSHSGSHMQWYQSVLSVRIKWKPCWKLSDHSRTTQHRSKPCAWNKKSELKPFAQNQKPHAKGFATPCST